MSVFGSRLKYLRESKAMTQHELAKLLEVSNVTICKYEKNDTFPDYFHLIEISKIFNVSLDYLCGSEYYLNEEEVDYNADDRLLKIIKRSKTLSNFILDDPRINVSLLENYIKQIK